MTKEETIAAFAALEALIQEAATIDREPQRARLDVSSMVMPPGESMAHLRFMCLEGRRLVEAGKTEKAMRWLGFVQGTLWGFGYVSIAEMKDMNRGKDGG